MAEEQLFDLLYFDLNSIVFNNGRGDNANDIRDEEFFAGLEISYGFVTTCLEHLHLICLLNLS